MDRGTPMPRSSPRRSALALVLTALWLPGIAAAAGHPSCCPGMQPMRDAAPCHQDPAPPPCETLDATPCCDVAPATALPAAAQRECSHTAAPALLRAPLAALAPGLAAAPTSALLSLHAPPPRLSVVLRN
jgi:hypothetical protein